MQNLNLLQRLAAETPPFWKKVQIGALIVSLILSYLFNLSIIPHNIILILMGIFAGVATVAQCAAQDTSIIQNAINDPSSLLTSLPVILDQVNQIHSAVTKPATVTLDTVTDEIKSVETPAITEIKS
jgi:hypothetical protein